MRSTSRASAAAAPREGAFRFSIQNWVLLALGLVAVVVGYVALAGGSTVLAPLLLVLGYCILIPLGIIR